MKLQLLQQFTIEVPTGTDTYDIIKGALIPESKKINKEIELKFINDINKAKSLQKKSNKIARFNQKIESLTDTISLIKDETLKMNKIDERQDLYNKAYALQDEIELETEALNQIDANELKAKEHIQRRLRADEENKGKVFELCEKYSYLMVFDTILKDIEEGKSKETKI